MGPLRAASEHTSADVSRAVAVPPDGMASRDPGLLRAVAVLAEHDASGRGRRSTVDCMPTADRAAPHHPREHDRRSSRGSARGGHDSRAPGRSRRDRATRSSRCEHLAREEGARLGTTGAGGSASTPPPGPPRRGVPPGMLAPERTGSPAPPPRHRRDHHEPPHQGRSACGGGGPRGAAIAGAMVRSPIARRTRAIDNRSWSAANSRLDPRQCGQTSTSPRDVLHATGDARHGRGFPGVRRARIAAAAAVPLVHAPSTRPPRAKSPAAVRPRAASCRSPAAAPSSGSA